jgi:DNA-binding IclR family transcriptional regulator
MLRSNSRTSRSKTPRSDAATQLKRATVTGSSAKGAKASAAAPLPADVGPDATPARSAPKHHRTVDRVTRILEEVVYNPGITLADLARTLEAPKSSVYGFIRGLIAQGWLYEHDRGFYLGPAVYGLTLASGHIRAGLVTQADLSALNQETGLTVLLGVQAGDNLIWVAQAGIDQISGFEARSNIRRTLLTTAGGKAILAAQTEVERAAYLRRRGPDESELIYKFLGEFEEIRQTGIAKNVRLAGMRSSLATAVRNQQGEVAAAVTLAGPTEIVQPRMAELRELLISRVHDWQLRSITPREVI